MRCAEGLQTFVRYAEESMMQFQQVHRVQLFVDAPDVGDRESTGVTLDNEALEDILLLIGEVLHGSMCYGFRGGSSRPTE